MDGSSAIVAHTIAEEPAVEDGSGRRKNLPSAHHCSLHTTVLCSA